MASYWDRLRQSLGGRNPPPPPPSRGTARPSTVAGLPEGMTGGGFRGSHTASEQMRLERLEAGGPTFIPPEEAKWEYVGEEEGAAFLRGEIELPAHSSNVRSARYHPDENAMTVTFKGKKNGADSVYRYLDISLNDAHGFLRAASKGGWVWTFLRVRGTKTGHHKPFVRLA